MISYSTKVENNVFKVTFNFSPKDITCSRSNYTATHRGAGTTARMGIWEGIEILDVQTKTGNGAWVSHGKSSSVTISTSDNGVPIQAWAKYQLRTMGYHFQCINGTLPFFYYGNVGGSPSRYVGGYFTDSAPINPGASLHSIHAIVPKDWTHTSTQWSDWAYQHALNSSNWAFASGRFEQRNGNSQSANSTNGWISDSGWAQAYRKSCMFYFQKGYYSSTVTSSGIVKDAKTPELTVHSAKGSGGVVTLKYIDSNNSPGKFFLRAYCSNKTVDIETYDSSATYSNNGTKQYYIDFNNVFGEQYQGNDVYYEAWARNSYNKTSPGTGRKGGHRFNGRPSIPNGVTVTGENNLIYTKVRFSWNRSTDPDSDSVVYYPYLITYNKNGVLIRNTQLSETTNNYLDFSIANDPDGSKYYFKVCASDRLLSSNWSNEIYFEKGSRPTGTVRMISPCVNNTNLYSDTPRFVFDGYDRESIFVVDINGQTYSSSIYPYLFTSEGSKMMFSANINLPSTIKIHAYLQNQYGTSDKVPALTFYRASINDNIKEGEIITSNVIKELQNKIKDKGKAYKLDLQFTNIVPKQTYITASIYNECYEALKTINTNLNKSISTSAFDVSMSSYKIFSNNLIDDKLWKNLIQDIKKI